MVQQLRVVDLAQTMGITPTELIFKLRSIGVSVTGEEDTLDLGTVRAIITGETLQKRPREVIVRRDTSDEEAAGTSARDRLARRKRRKIIKTEREIAEVGGHGPATETPADAKAGAGATAAAAVEELEEPAAEAVETAEEVAVDEAAAEEVAAAQVEPAEEMAAAAPAGDATAATAEDEDEDEEAVAKPKVEISEEELTAARAETPEEPQRVRARKAHTPLEQGLRELSPDEIKERLKAQRTAEKRARSARKTGTATSRKAKAAADAREIRDLLNKFEEQKLKSQQETTTPAARPARRPGPGARPAAKRRKRRLREDTTPAPPQPRRTVQFKDGERPEGPIILSEMVTPKELADKLNITVKDLLGVLIQRGVMVTTNQSLPHELAEQVCADLEIEAMVASVEELIEYEREEAEEAAGPTVSRPPVVTVMGHVDHGKTSLLDAIRSSRVAEQEAGGITQHIGASRITAPGDRSVVFIDTPGHEAFTHMRARGAQVTDIVVLVVAADDGVMPQTVEAINHARAAGVPLIVAINKIDKANANPDRVKQALTEQEVLVEDWGGDVPSVEVSAKKHTGIDDLLDMILLVSELKDLKATHEGPARGVVLEARKEKGRGIVATVLVQQGTLSVGDYFFCGSTWGRVRALTSDLGQRVDEAGPSDPVEVTGFDTVPGAGDLMQVVETEERALEVASYRSQREKEDALMATRKVSLENLFDQIAADAIKELHIVVKADVQGSVEVLRDTLTNLSTEKVKITVLHGSVGAVTTNDVMLASASNAIIIGFNVRPERTAKNLAEEEQVDIRLYTVIYNLIEDIKKAMVGLLEPEFREEDLGQAEVREIFRVPKIGAIAGCHVTEGVVPRNAKVRLLRDNVVVHEGTIASLRRFKEDASEVRQGFECGIGLERYQDIKVGDVIEAYHLVEVAPEL